MALWGLWHSKSWGASEGLIVGGAFRVTEETTETKLLLMTLINQKRCCCEAKKNIFQTCSWGKRVPSQCLTLIWFGVIHAWLMENSRRTEANVMKAFECHRRRKTLGVNSHHKYSIGRQTLALSFCGSFAPLCFRRNHVKILSTLGFVVLCLFWGVAQK